MVISLTSLTVANKMARKLLVGENVVASRHWVLLERHRMLDDAGLGLDVLGRQAF